MINRTEFTKHLGLLLDRFGRSMSEPTIAEYYRLLNAELTTDAFQRAAREIFRHDQFWPSPQRFVDAAQGGSSKELAEAAWGEVLRLAQRGEYPPLDAFDAATRAALKAVPMREIQYADSEAKLARLKREFTAAHATATANHATGTQPALPSGTPELTR